MDAEHRSLLGRALVATAVGFLVGYAAVTLPLLDAYRGSLAVKVLADPLFALHLVDVPLAGAAVAAFAR